MIVTLSGLVAEKIGDVVVIDVHGVGYGTAVTAEDYGRLNIGETVKVYVYEHIREGIYDLYAFIKQDTKKIFQQLLDVNGVGPKMALNVLSIGTTDQVRHAIATGDTKFIQHANGVGKRVAERIVVDLKDKIGITGVDLSESGIFTGTNTVISDDAVQALIALGYTAQDAASALKDIDSSLPTEERVKLALKGRR